MSMNYDNAEVITKARCAECGDKLTSWELESGQSLCILCEDQSNNNSSVPVMGTLFFFTHTTGTCIIKIHKILTKS